MSCIVGQIIKSTFNLLGSGFGSRLVCVAGVTLAAGIFAAGHLALDSATPAGPPSS